MQIYITMYNNSSRAEEKKKPIEPGDVLRKALYGGIIASQAKIDVDRHKTELNRNLKCSDDSKESSFSIFGFCGSDCANASL